MVKFTNEKGENIAVNPRYVAYVKEDTFRKSYCILYMHDGGGEIVNGEYDEVIDRLIHGQTINAYTREC
jgi:hypothetical protein